MEKTPIKPSTINHRVGVLFPIAERLLNTHKYWSVSRWLPHSAIYTDLYIMSWWILETSFISFECLTSNTRNLWIIVFLCTYRYLDLMFVLSSILVKGFYKRQDWHSAHRVTLLVTFNAIEIMILFAILYRALGLLLPEIALTRPVLNSFYDALYFSIITGTSIGYGIPHPAGWLSKLLAMLEGSSIVLVVIAVIGYISNEKSKEIRQNPLEK